MHAISLGSAILFLISVGFQVAGLVLLPMTRGFTDIVYTPACVLVFIIGIGLLARLSAMGVQLSILIPITAAVVPLTVIAVAFLFYNEPASVLKISLLLTACVIIGVASST